MLSTKPKILIISDNNEAWIDDFCKNTKYNSEVFLKNKRKEDLQDFSLVILNTNENVNDYIDFIKHYKNNATPIPTLVIIDETQIAATKKYLDAGANDFIIKNNNFNDIIYLKIDKLIEEYQSCLLLKNTNQKLEEQIELNRLIAENTSEAIWIYDVLGEKLIYMNEATKTLLGYGKEDLLDTNIETYFSPENFINYFTQLQIRIDSFERGNHKQKFAISNHFMCTKHGEKIETEHSSTLITGNYSKVEKVLIVWRDITEKSKFERLILENTEQLNQKNIEIQNQMDELALTNEKLNAINFKLTEKEKQLQAIIDKSPWGMHFYRLDKKGRLFFMGANPAADEILKIDHKVLIGKTIEEAFPGFAQTDIPLQFKKVAQFGYPFTIDRIHYDDSKIKGNFSIVAFRNEEMKVIVSFNEISEKIKFEEEIKLKNEAITRQNAALVEAIKNAEFNEEKLKRIIDLAVDAFFHGDSNGNFIMVNEAASVLTGYTKEELLTMNMRDLFSQSMLKEKPLRYDLLTEGIALKTERNILIKNGKIIPVEMFSKIMPDGTYQSFVRDISERKKNEEVLINYANQWKTTFDSVVDGVSLIDPKGIILQCNKAMLQLFSCESKNIIGMQCWEVVHGTNKPIENCPIQRMKNSLKREVIEIALGNKWFEIAVDPIVDNKNVLLGAVHIVRDITDRVLANEALKESEARFKTLAEIAPVGIFRTDAQGSTTYVNPYWINLTKVPFEKALGDSWLDAVHPEDKIRLKKGWDETVEHKGTSTAEYRFVNPDGKIVWVLGQAVPSRDKNGVIVGYIGTITNITERKQTEEIIKLNEKRLKDAQKLAKIASYERNIVTKEEFWSDEMYALFGYKINEIQPSEEFFIKHIHPDDLKRITFLMRDLFASKSNFEFEYRIITKQKNIKYILASGNIIRNKNGQPIEIEGTLQDITERKLYEIAIQESEANLKVIFDNSKDIIVLLDNQYNIVSANKSLLNFIQKTPNEIVNKNYFSILPKTVALYRQEKMQLVLNQKKAISFEDEAYGKFWWNSFIPVFDAKNQLTKIAVFEQDISERKRIQEIEQQSLIQQQWLAEFAFNLNTCTTQEHVYDMIAQLVFKTNPQCSLFFVNNNVDGQYLHITKTYNLKIPVEKINNLLGITLLDFKTYLHEYAEEDLNNLKKSVITPVKNGIFDIAAKKIPYFICQSLEKLLGIKKVYVMGLNAGNEHIGGIAILSTNTEPLLYKKLLENAINQAALCINRIKTEHLLKQSEERFKGLVENLEEGVAVLNEKMEFVFFNPTIEKIFDKKREDIIGKNLKLFIQPQDFIEISNAQEQIHKGITFSKEITISNTQNDTTWLRITISNYNDKRLPKGGTINFIRNITKEKQTAELQNLLEVAQKTAAIRQQFLANMSHEMRTPMNGIIGMTEFLSKTDLSKNQEEFVTVIKESARNLLSLINDILEISKIETGSETLMNTHVETKELIKEINQSFVFAAQKKNIEFTVYANKDAPDCFVIDKRRLCQIVSNLIDNAIKFTPKGMIAVSFDIKEKDELLEVVVTDTGIGIELQYLDKIFDKFVQAPNPNANETEGAGLGLAICKKLANLMGGDISVKSEVGKGSSFILQCKFEKCNEKHTDSKNKENFSSKADVFDLKILLVEDKFVNRKVAELMLKNLGCQVDIAENGVIAIDKIKENNYDIVLLDIQMPVMDGVTALNELKKMNIKLPIIIGLSAQALSGDADRFIEMGMDDYITKPLLVDDLKEKLRRWSSKIKDNQ